MEAFILERIAGRREARGHLSAERRDESSIRRMAESQGDIDYARHAPRPCGQHPEPRRLRARRAGAICRGRCRATSPAASRTTSRCATIAPRSLEWASCRACWSASASARRPSSCSARAYAHPFGIAPMGISALTAYRGDLVLARCATAGEHPDGAVGLVADPPRGSRRGGARRMVPGVPARRPAAHRRAGRPRRGRRLQDARCCTVDTPATPNRENNIRAGFTTPLRPSVRLALDGITHPRWLFGTFLRTLSRHGMPHFENTYATRGVADAVARRGARFLRARPSRLDARRAHPQPMVRHAGDQGHPASGRCAHRARPRRRRDHRLEPRRPPARRRRRAAARAAGDRRCVPRDSR